MSYAAMKECWLDLKRAPAAALAEILPDHAEIQQLAQHARDEGSSLGADDLRPLWNLAAGHDVSRWDQLAVRIDHAYSVRRAH